MIKIEKIVIDESVTKETYNRFVPFLQKKGYEDINAFFVADKHQGMPDNQILHHFLNENTIFLTSDRPLHNKVLSVNIQSYCFLDDNFIGSKLKGIKISKTYAMNKDELELRESYHLPKTEIRYHLLPLSERSLQKLSVKRRRIRGRFGGMSHLDETAITVSWKACKKSTLFGIKIRVSSNIGIKAFDASESYIIDNILPEDRGVVALNYAMILAIQLMLNSIKTNLFYDSPQIRDPLIHPQKDQSSLHVNLFPKLHESFSSIEFIPTVKGKLIERLRAKLQNLSVSKTNEIITGDISEVSNRALNCVPEAE